MAALYEKGIEKKLKRCRRGDKTALSEVVKNEDICLPGSMKGLLSARSYCRYCISPG